MSGTARRLVKQIPACSIAEVALVETGCRICHCSGNDGIIVAVEQVDLLTFDVVERIDLVRGSLNPQLEIQGVVLTMFDKRNNLSEQVAEDVRKHLGEKVYQTIIPRNVRISEAPSHGLPALLYDVKSAGSQAYIKLAGELIQRERSRKAA
jgi:cellulose biosynthesis protein BcsQ